MMDDDAAALLGGLGELLITTILDDEGSIKLIEDLVDQGAPLWYQSVAEGISPLHAAAYIQNEPLVKFLIEKGAIWNSVDNLGHTAGEVALSFNSQSIYHIIRDAGIRAEMLLALLSGRPLAQSPASLVLHAQDDTAAASTDVFLASKLKFVRDGHGQDICMLQVGDEEVGVMMGWEREIMEETVKLLTREHPESRQLKVLNVGFGLGIIDSLFQELPDRPVQHYIIEPHPDVLQHMKELGWHEKPGVTILQGKWQDFVGKEELLALGGFDVVYIDTFSENYQDLHAFFEHLPDLLASPDSRFGFFNGLGATNALFYDVYTHLSELHLADIRIHVAWTDVRVQDSDRWGSTRQYFTLPMYRLPVAVMKIS
ncbi:arginine methyl transferase [Mycena floridula]|nr:arginine methyl transferase [Mycena floridula]